MNATPGQAGSPQARRRWPWRVLAWLGLPLAALVVLGLLVLVALPPERVVPMLLARIGATLDLEISAEGDPASQFGAHPTFAVRNVVARQPGAARPLLQARRVVVALPWRTIRSLGDPLDLVRVELDAPQLDVAALQRWLETRPPGTGRLPTLSDGLLVRDAAIDGGSWRIADLQLSLAEFFPDRPLRARATGRYDAGALRMPFQLAASLQRPESGQGFGLAGQLAPATADWRLPAWITLSGRLHWDDGLRLLPARFGTRARIVTATTTLPFSLGLHGPLRAHAGAWTLVPAAVALRGEGVLPVLDARGRLALGERLLLALDGRVAQWPEAWPALPPPLGRSREPLAVTLQYLGPLDLSAPLALDVARGEALRFSGALRVPALLAWSGAGDARGLLPPLSGRLEAERIEISGARLEGVAVDFEEDAPATPGAHDTP